MMKLNQAYRPKFITAIHAIPWILLGALIVNAFGFRPLSAGQLEKSWVHIVEVSDEFESAVGFLRSSIEEEGLTIANEGDVADMMRRTAKAVENATTPYNKARIFQFCSAQLGFRLFAEMAEALAACPLTIFAFELKAKPGVVHIGFRRPPETGHKGADDVLKDVEALLARVVKRATE